MENNLNDIFDPIDDSLTGESGYVPRFERDLQKAGGNLTALADAKKTEQKKSEESTDNAPENEAPSYAEEVQSASADNGYYQGKTVEELIKENEEQERLEREKAAVRSETEAYHNLEDVKITENMISDMGYNYKQEERNNKLKQKELDELALSLGSKPKVEEMSDEYFPNAPLKKKDSFSSQEALDRDEKLLIKERLQKEIDSRPKGINKKNSAELYKNLMHEQKVKKAKRGLLSLVIMAIGGIIAALILNTRLNSDELKFTGYIAMGGVAFSLIMLLKAKFFRTFSCLFFSAETVYIVYTCVNFALNTEQKPDNYFETLIYFIVVIAICAVIAIQLATNANIECYYTTSFSKKKTAKSTPKKGGSQQVRQNKK